MSNLDKYLKKFEYKNALLAAFKSKKSEVIYSLIEELIQRGVLKLALKKWDEEELKLILEFAANKINSSKFQQIIIEIINIIIGFKNIWTY